MDIESNLHSVLKRIAAAAESVNRNPGDVRLIVVSKGQSIEKIRTAANLGVSDFGENYLQEAAQKIQGMDSQLEINWHMIGHIQSRKAKDVCKLFDYIQTIDSLKLAKRLDRFAGELGKKMPVMIECNVSGEISKYGFQVWDEEGLESFLKIVPDLVKLPNLGYIGLMTMAPFVNDVEQVRPNFRSLRNLRRILRDRFPDVGWAELSMGMSSDFEVAIQEGATIVRIGQAIMGAR